jgi:hypothetical protein
LLDKTSLTRPWRSNKTNVVCGMDLRFSRLLNGHDSVSSRLNGHPSGPFDQDVSNSCSICKTPTYSVARNEPSVTYIRMVKYYTLSVGSVCEISRPRATSGATRPSPGAPPTPMSGRSRSWPRMLPHVTPTIHSPSAMLRWRLSSGSARDFRLAPWATSCRTKLGEDRHRAGPQPC